MPPIGGSVASWEHLVHKKFLKPHDEEMATGKDAVFPEWQTATDYRSVGTKRLQGSESCWLQLAHNFRFIFNPQLIFFFSSSRVVVFSLRSEGGLTKRAAGMCSLRSSQAWLEDCFPSAEPGWWTGENLSKRAANHRRTIWNKEAAAHFSWFLLDTSPACPGCSSSGGDCQDQSAGFAVTCVTHLSGLRLSVAEIASVCDTH